MKERKQDRADGETNPDEVEPKVSAGPWGWARGSGAWMTPAKGPESSWIKAKRLVPELPPDPTPVSHGLQLSLGRRHRCGHGSFLWQRTIPRQRRNSWRGNWLQFVSAANTPSCRQNKTHKTGEWGRRLGSVPQPPTSFWPCLCHKQVTLNQPFSFPKLSFLIWMQGKWKK